MRRRWVLAGSAVAVTVALAGCSASGDAPRATRTSAAVSPGGSATTRPVDAGQDGVAATISAREICAALKGIRPAVRKADTDRAARAEISVRLTQVYSAKQLAGQMKPATVDALSRKTCPGTRTALLRSAGLKSLADI